ncbi:31323_t:CDS:2, partial [Racocetra persica]
MFFLGDLYLNGKPGVVEKNEELGYKYLELAASHNNEKAISLLETSISCKVLSVAKPETFQDSRNFRNDARTYHDRYSKGPLRISAPGPIKSNDAPREK